MRFRIEYLAQAAVVHHKAPYALSLDGATAEARKGYASAQTLFGANGFQIRDMEKQGKIVAEESLPATDTEPLETLTVSTPH